MAFKMYGSDVYFLHVGRNDLNLPPTVAVLWGTISEIHVKVVDSPTFSGVCSDFELDSFDCMISAGVLRSTMQLVADLLGLKNVSPCFEKLGLDMDCIL